MGFAPAQRTALPENKNNVFSPSPDLTSKSSGEVAVFQQMADDNVVNSRIAQLQSIANNRNPVQLNGWGVMRRMATTAMRGAENMAMNSAGRVSAFSNRAVHAAEPLVGRAKPIFEAPRTKKIIAGGATLAGGLAMADKGSEIGVGLYNRDFKGIAGTLGLEQIKKKIKKLKIPVDDQAFIADTMDVLKKAYDDHMPETGEKRIKDDTYRVIDQAWRDLSDQIDNRGLPNFLAPLISIDNLQSRLRAVKDEYDAVEVHFTPPKKPTVGAGARPFRVPGSNPGFSMMSPMRITPAMGGAGFSPMLGPLGFSHAAIADMIVKRTSLKRMTEDERAEAEAILVDIQSDIDDEFTADDELFAPLNEFLAMMASYLDVFSSESDDDKRPIDYAQFGEMTEQIRGFASTLDEFDIPNFISPLASMNHIFGRYKKLETEYQSFTSDDEFEVMEELDE